MTYHCQKKDVTRNYNTLIAGENCGLPRRYGDISPLKRLLPHSSSSLSQPFTLSGPNSDLHNLSVQFCSKVISKNTSFTNRPYYTLIPDRLRDYSGLRPLMDYPMLSPLHGKKIGSCRGQCFHSHCLLSIQNLQTSQTSGAQQDTTTSLLSPYGLYRHSLPLRPHFSSITGSSKPSDIIMASSESLLHQTAWHSTVNHCL